MTAFADLVETSVRVAATSSRREKVEVLADFLKRVDSSVAEPAVAFLSGSVPHGALGVGWATIGEPPTAAETPSLSIQAVVETLDDLAGTGGPGSYGRRRDLVGGLLGAATFDEQRFLVSLLTGDVRQGALEGAMIEAVARAAGVEPQLVRRAAMLNGRIWEVAALALSGGEEVLAAVGLTLFRPVKPMLARTAESVSDALLSSGPASVEWKLDGVRIQVHRQDERVEVYTRNLNPVTERLGDIAEAVRGLPCRSAVLDGEALAVDEEGRPARFQETAGRFGTEEMAERGLQAHFFDLLHLDGEDLFDQPLSRRRRRLEALAGESVVPGRDVRNEHEAARVLSEALAMRHEGVMVKSLDSRYEAGRRGASWLKVKPVHSLDLVVLAAEWGHGRRQGWLSNLHLGARGGEGLVMVGKTFKGLTDQMLEWQTRRLQEIEERRTRGTVFVRPELVVEIAIDGVQVSSRYPGGVALRFARVRAYRPDKEPEQADTIEAVRALAGLPSPNR